ncbi:MAG: hypothetical protein K1X87_04455 [Dehalococcoidia bacterium]|nr:hypothetical protein [Dehalococcoidia bacterium]
MTLKEPAILEVVAPTAPSEGSPREIRRRSQQLLYVLALALAGLALAHVVLIDAFRREAPDHFRALLVIVEVIFVGLLLAAAANYFIALSRERGGAALLASLTAAFAAPRAEDVHTVAVAQLVGSGMASSALFAVARDQGHRLEPVAACGYPAATQLEERDSYGLVPPQPVVRQQVELTDPWLDPVRERVGREPWVSRVPILRGDELLGLVILADPQPGLISDQALLRRLGDLLAVALSGGAVPAARAAGVSQADWTRHELIEATAAEFGPPLLAVEAFASAVAGDADEVGTIEDARRLSTLALSVERLGVVMSDLSTLGAGPEALVVGDAESIDLAPTLDASVDALVPAFTAREQGLTLELANEPLVAFVSPDAVERLLLHLLSNANRAAPDGGSIVVRAADLGGSIQIEVEDSGPPPPGDELQRALDPFYRIPSARGDLPGAGLGLAVARRLTESQRGTFEARPAASGGTSYVVQLPTEPPPPPEEVPPPPAEDAEESAPLEDEAALPDENDDLEADADLEEWESDLELEAGDPDDVAEPQATNDAFEETLPDEDVEPDDGPLPDTSLEEPDEDSHAEDARPSR